MLGLSMPKPRLSETIRIPPDLAKALRTRPKIRATFSHLPPSHQRRYVDWITGGIKQITRRKRIAETLTMITKQPTARRT